jgi:putative hydrolase of HD superfamily
LPASARQVLSARSKHEAERRAMQELLAAMPGQTDYLNLWSEYVTGSSPEGRLIKGIDRIEMLAQALAYERAGNRALTEFWIDADQGWSDEFPILGSLAMHLLEVRDSVVKPS